MAVDEVYGRWLLARRRLGFIGPLVARSAELSRRAESARRREVITGFDARVLKGDVAELEAEQLDALRELDEADAELKLRAGLPAGQPLRLDDDLDGGRWGCAVDSLTLIAQRSRADLARAGAAESLAASRVGFERRMSAPNLTLGVSAGREGRSFEGSAGTQRDESTILGIHATIPLPWGRSFGAVHEAQVELGRAQAERAGLDRTMREEVAVACAGLARAESRRELLRIAASSAAADLLLTESAYREGRIPLEQYLTVRERLVRIQREALDAVSAVEAGRARLVRATGLRRDVLAASLSSTER